MGWISEVTKGIFGSLLDRIGTFTRGNRLDLNGGWFATWTTTVSGRPNVNTEEIQIVQRGNQVTLRNTNASPDNPEGYLWHSSCTLHDNHHLIGYYVPVEKTRVTKGTLYLVIDRSGNFLTGMWAGCTPESDLTWGFVAFAHDREVSREKLKDLTKVHLLPRAPRGNKRP